MSEPNSGNKKFNSTIHQGSSFSFPSNSEKNRMFERISQKERQIEESVKEHKASQKMFYKIQFENNELEKRGAGRYNSKNEVHQQPPFEPCLRKLPVPHVEAPEAPKRCRKPGPPISHHHTIRNPVIQGPGETSQVVKAKEREFAASLQSQSQNFKRFFLPSEWKEFNAAASGKNSTQILRPFSSIKSVLQYEYASPKAN